MVSREELQAIRTSGTPTEEIDRRDIESRIDKASEELDRLQSQIDELKESGEEIAQKRERIVETRDEIREVRAEVTERAEVVERRAVEVQKTTTQIREKAQTVRRTQEEIIGKVQRVKAAVPPPDVIDKIGGGFGALEKPFADVSRGMRIKAEEIRPERRRGLPDPSEITGLPGPGQPGRGPKEAIGLGLRAGASAFDAFTMPVRPILVGETVVTTAKLFVDPKTRKAFVKSAADDPAGFGADILGGAVGGYALGYGLGKVRQVYTRRRYLTDLPDEAFLVPEEAAFSYPQPETVSKVSTHEYLRKVGEMGVVDDLDVWSGPMTFDKGRMGFRRTGAEMLPELVPDQAPTSSIYKPGVTKFIETAETFRPAVRVPTSPRITPPGVSLALTTGLGILSSLKAPEEITRPEEIVDVAEEARIMTGGSTRVRRRPKPTEPGFIEAERVIEFGGVSERQRDLIAPRYKPRHVQRSRQRPIMDVTVEPTLKETQKERLVFSWPRSFSRPRGPEPVYRPRMAKEALKRGRGSWGYFGEYRTYLKGDPLKALEVF